MPSDPVMSIHARERCEEMGISTKVAKAIVKNPSVTRPGKPGSPCMIAVSDAAPGYAVVYDPRCEPLVVVSVLFRTIDQYDRDGETYMPHPREEI